MSRVRIKICGITCTEDAQLAAGLGADAIGCNFYPGSSRVVTAERAAEIVACLPPFVTGVGLFVDPEPAAVHAVLDRVPLDLLQFQGSETSVFCASFGLPYVQGVRVSADLEWDAEYERVSGASAILLDTFVDGRPGGTGECFDWKLIPEGIDRPLILAGGLSADNVAAAIREVHPFAVDVCGGVEASPGIKDPARMRAFIDAVGAVQDG